MIRLILIFTLLCCFGLVSYGQTAVEKPANKEFDAELAKRTGADEYGMRKYVLAVLKTGPNDSKIVGSERTDIFKGHMANIGRLADLGKIAVAGPFGKNDKQYRGLFIFAVDTVEEAQKLAETDPVISSGMMIVEFTPWYGSAALMETNSISKKLAKKSF